MFCSKCGGQVADAATFCPTCGQATGAQAPAPRGIPLAPGGFAPAGGAGVAQPAVPTPAIPAPGYAVSAPARGIAYAGFWLRFVAWIIDFVVLWIVSTFTSMIFMASSGMRGMILNNPPQTPEQLFAMLGSFSKLIFVNCVIQWLYYALLESSTWQGTLGKKALGLEVTDMAGRRVSFARATGRYFGKIISSIIFLIGFIMAGFTAQKQALHDMMAGCLVIRKI